MRRLGGSAAPQPSPSSGASYGRRLVRLLRERASSIAAFLAIILMFDTVRSWSIDAGVTPLVQEPVWTMASIAAIAPMLVEAAGLRGTRLAVATFAGVVGALGVAAILFGMFYPGPVVGGVGDGAVLSNDAFLFRTWWLYSAAGLTFAAYCLTRAREQRALAAAREAELERAGTQREIVASRLKVLQARVEPELLFDALADVRDAYLDSPPAADALLDDLVAYLRAALPQMRGGASTLGREAALAEAYLRVVPAGREKRLSANASIAPEVADEDFPPMVLLPLVHAAADAGATDVAMEAHRLPGEPTRHEVIVRVAGGAVPAGWSDDALHVVRETLLHYLGGDATLSVSGAADGAVAAVTWAPDASRRLSEVPPAAGTPDR